MKVLFLDIDGVLNCSTTPVNDMWPLDPYKVLLLHRILDQTGAYVVLSSAWRHSALGMGVVEDAIVPHKLIDKTPSFATIRGEEIKAWLRKHPDVEQYAILDDDDDMLSRQMPHFFQTSWKEGLTEEIAEAVTKHLL